MFNPSIKEEKFIIIEDDFENVEASTKKREKRNSLPKKSVSKGKRIISPPTGPVTRASTRLEEAKEMAKGISETPEYKQDYFEDSDRIPDVPEAIVSKYQVKSKEPRVALNLNEPAPCEEC
jgi:hypothetical protein